MGRAICWLRSRVGTIISFPFIDQSTWQTSTNILLSEIEHIWQMSWRTSFYRGGPVFMSALAGIDIALWDLKARKLNVPIYQLLGGKVRDKLKVYAWIGGDRPSDVRAQA
jgi:galactonate dehydratase